ncbi:MAG TPA: 4-hydroxy-3-methylbut-2-enyl diphosphate reductase [Acidimicrobiales bacterium]|nr:4-hydroxy-3-methylbut-2-enyl diphosphate reductase [Acidimicrobiales bacterium]
MSARRSGIVLTPRRAEARAVAGGAPALEVIATGVGPERARRSAINLAARCQGAPAVAVAGWTDAAGRPHLEPGDVVVASEVRGPFGTVPLPSAPLVASALARTGLRVDERAVTPAHDEESAWLVEAAPDRPRVVVRVVADDHHTLAAYRSLRRSARVLDRWAAAARPRTVLLPEPRSFCAGVERAIEVVERALDRYGPPVYVRRQIIHNRHVVADLESRGAVFVEEVDQAPEGARLVFSAHGVSPAVEAAAAERGQAVIDATCPLVAKVHREVRRFSERDYSVVLVGHAHHDEVEGTIGEAPDIRLVSTADDAAAVDVPDPERVAYVTQTTLALDDVAEVVDVLRDRFPGLVGPAADDVCYATQNRQDAVRAIADECDLLLVVGSQNSSNSQRLVEVAERAGCPAHLVDDERDIDLAWLAGAATVGVTAGASAPSWIVDRVVASLGGLGPLDVRTRTVTAETVRFSLPEEVR